MNSIVKAKPHTCPECGKSFGRMYDLRRHERSVHLEDESPKDEESDTESELDVSGTESEPAGYETDSESSSYSSDELEDNAAYLDWKEESKQATQDMWADKYEKYLNRGMSDDEAREQADVKTSLAVKRIFFQTLRDVRDSQHTSER